MAIDSPGDQPLLYITLATAENLGTVVQFYGNTDDRGGLEKRDPSFFTNIITDQTMGVIFPLVREGNAQGKILAACFGRRRPRKPGSVAFYPNEIMTLLGLLKSENAPKDMLKTLCAVFIAEMIARGKLTPDNSEASPTLWPPVLPSVKNLDGNHTLHIKMKEAGFESYRQEVSDDGKPATEYRLTARGALELLDFLITQVNANKVTLAPGMRCMSPDGRKHIRTFRSTLESYLVGVHAAPYAL